MRIGTQQVRVSFGSAEILKGISMDVEHGEFVGVIGPNGCGKSTLLKCIYRVLKPSGGAVLLDDKPLQQYKMRESAKRMAVVSQHNFYNFDFSVRDVVLMGRAPHKKALERDNEEDYRIVRESLRKVDMLAYEDRSFSTLSGGEQQRIILARALTQGTPCLILDEPTNHLDIKYQLQLMNIVKGLGVTVISAIHDLNIAALYCSKLVVMKEGAVVAYGTPAEVLTAELIRAVYEVEAEIGQDAYGNISISYRVQ